MSIEKKSKLKQWIKNRRDQRHEKEIDRLKEAVRKKKIILKKLNSESFLTDKDKIKVKQIEEEIIKMAKMILKDGKLMKKEEVSEETGIPPQQPQPPMQEQSTVPMQEQPQANPFEGTPMPPPQELQQGLVKQQHEQLIQQQLAQSQQEQLVQQQLAQQQMAQQQMAQQQMAQQQMAQQPVKDIPVTIEIIDGKPITVSVGEDQLEKFLQDLSSAVDDAGSFRIGNRFINCRYVITYHM